jgi:hypothetical protein
MNKRAILGKAIAAVALSAALAGVGVDTASARPTTGGLRDACTGAGGTWTMDGYVPGRQIPPPRVHLRSRRGRRHGLRQQRQLPRWLTVSGTVPAIRRPVWTVTSTPDPGFN